MYLGDVSGYVCMHVGIWVAGCGYVCIHICIWTDGYVCAHVSIWKDGCGYVDMFVLGDG